MAGTYLIVGILLATCVTWGVVVWVSFQGEDEKR